jgi:hypothetical protein
MVNAGRWGVAVVDERVARIDEVTAPLRAQVAGHAVAELIDDIDSVRIFMEHHVVAVWDFMSLLKCLQREVTCVDVPWTPRGDPSHRRFVNELVLAEESDVGVDGGHTSHFELYVAAMAEVGADRAPITALLDRVARGEPDPTEAAGLPPAAAAFARTTLAAARGASPHVLAATFAFGRERLIPAMFTSLREAARRPRPELRLLLAYLDRHIELDAEEHTPLAFSLVQGLCGDDPERWREAEDAAVAACRQRLALWDATAAAIEARRQAGVAG